jgi:hypothetical protein
LRTAADTCIRMEMYSCMSSPVHPNLPFSSTRNISAGIEET